MTRMRITSALLGITGALLAGGVAEIALAEDSADEISFVVVGHLRGEPDDEPFFLMEELVADIAALEPDMVFLTGDLIFGDWHHRTADPERIRAHWDRLDASLDRIGAPIHRVPGNHDINDAVTRDIWFERYGEPPQSVTLGNSLFLLLASPYIHVGDGPPAEPRPHPRGVDLSDSQIGFVRRQLDDSTTYDHVFTFMHHVLWWGEDRAWWTQVHPLLVANKGRAVFAGDYGPMKFSYEEHDGIDYVQTSLGAIIPTEGLRLSEHARLLNFQLDTYLHVTVRGDDVDIDVRTLGARSSGKYHQDIWREVFAPDTSVSSKVERALGGPTRRAVLAALLAGSFALGAFAMWLRMRKQS